MVRQYTISLSPKSRGFHLITNELLSKVGQLPDAGIFHVFIQHTSAALTINENADPDVRKDFETYYNTIIPENIPGLRHTYEGSDDMPSHIKSSITGVSLSIPITNGRLNLGTWQGIYLCEFRNFGGARKIVVSILS